MATIPILLRRLMLIKNKCFCFNYALCIISARRFCVPVSLNREVEINNDEKRIEGLINETLATIGPSKDLERKGEIALNEDLNKVLRSEGVISLQLGSAELLQSEEIIALGQPLDEGIQSKGATVLCRDSDKLRQSKGAIALHQASDELLRDLMGESWISPPHSIAYSKRIHSLCNAGEVDKAHKLLDAMIEQNASLKPHYFNYVSVAYAKANRCQEALEVCNSMQKYGFRPHQTTYHTIMSNYLKQGKVLDALDMFDRMRRDGWQPNEVTTSIVAYGLCRAGHTDQVKALFQERFEKSGIISTSVCNALLESFFRSGNVESAAELEKRIFSGLCFPNAFTYATMIRGRCRQGKADEAKKLFLEMEKKGCRPILACYGSIIALLCKQSRYKDAYNLFNEMQREGIEAEGTFCVVLLKQLTMRGMIDEALQVCKYATEKRIFVDDSTFLLLLEALSNANRLGEAKPFLDNLMEKGCMSSVRRFQQALHTLRRRENLIRERDSHIQDPDKDV